MIEKQGKGRKKGIARARPTADTQEASTQQRWQHAVTVRVDGKCPSQSQDPQCESNLRVSVRTKHGTRDAAKHRAFTRTPSLEEHRGEDHRDSCAQAEDEGALRAIV